MDSLEYGCDHVDFTFAFNNRNFSDRVLRICIFSQPIESTKSPERVETLHISSLILAARSPFFYKLFANGMSESKRYDVTLRINSSEEAGLMELIKFMYSNKLSVTSAAAVLNVLVAADKYDVASCVGHCGRLLENLLITSPEFVPVYLDLPSNITMAEALQPLTVVAKQLYAVRYNYLTKFEDEILNLPLVDVEKIIASDDLEVTSEYDVYLFVLKWARFHYPKIEERREIIMTRLAKFIRYPYMTHKQLYYEVLDCNEFDPFFAKDVVREAVIFKDNCIDPKYIANDDSHRFVKRVGYKHHRSTCDQAGSIRDQVAYVLGLFISYVPFAWVRKLLMKGLHWLLGINK